jgi:hypothetical protein
MILIVVGITLIPFDFHPSARIRIHWSVNTADIITNVFLFIPIGFLFRLSRKTDTEFMGLKSLGFGIFLSFLIETAQIFVPARYTQIIDVVTNGLGAWLGSTLYTFLQIPIRTHGMTRVFALELPLMNIAYLLIPLMWLNGLALGDDMVRLGLLPPLALVGILILASIYDHQLKNNSDLTPKRLSLFAVSWFMVAALPAFLRFPIPIIIFGTFLSLFVLVFSHLPAKAQNGEKRFELPVLKKVLPLYAVYLILMAVWPSTIPLNNWQFNLDFDSQNMTERIVFIFRFIEEIAAFTLLGYMLAEMRGRKDESIDKTIGWVLFITAGAAISIQILRTALVGSSLNLFEILLTAAAGIYGAVIYRLQLSAIRR